MSLSRKLGIVFIATILTRLVFHYLTDFTADDAFITYRYAENLASGLGFVYNEGERVLGTTTPLYTLILSLLVVFRLPVLTASLFVSLLCSGLTGVILYRFACSLRFTRWAVLPVLCYALWPRSLAAETCGMETSLFTLLVTAAFYFQHRRLDIYAIGMATLATVTRPEGALALVLLVIYNCYRQRDRILQYLLVPLAIVGPWLIFAHFYFGSVIPNSAAGKLALYSLWGTMPLWDTIVYLMAWHTPFGWAMTLAAVAGGYWLNRKQYFGWLEIIWMVAMLIFYITSGARIFFWYVVPTYPIYILFITAGVPFVLDRLKMPTGRERVVRVLAVGAVSIVLLIASYKPVEYYRNLQEAMVTMHKAIGLYLYSNTGKNDLVAAEDIGYMGYYSHRRILDRDGLVSPKAIPYNRQGDYLGLITDHRPEWVVASTDTPMSRFITDSLFLSLYETKTSFSFGISQYNVYARRD